MTHKLDGLSLKRDYVRDYTKIISRRRIFNLTSTLRSNEYRVLYSYDERASSCLTKSGPNCVQLKKKKQSPKLEIYTTRKILDSFFLL